MLNIPKPFTLRKLANALGVPARDVFEAVGIEPVTFEDQGIFFLRTQADKERFLELARLRQFPPTKEEEALILQLPDFGHDLTKAFVLEPYDEPTEDREWLHGSMRDMIAGNAGNKPSTPTLSPAMERPTHGEYPLSDLEWGIVEQGIKAGVGVYLDAMPGLLDVPPDHPMRKELFWGIAEAVKQAERLRRWSEEDKSAN